MKKYEKVLTSWTEKCYNGYAERQSGKGRSRTMKRIEYAILHRPFENMSMAQKREAILQNLEAIKNSEKFEQYKGYAPIELLRSNICMIMEWKREVKTRLERGGCWTYILLDTGCANCTKTIDRMAEQGFIQISKSGKGFRVLKTK